MARRLETDAHGNATVSPISTAEREHTAHGPRPLSSLRRNRIKPAYC